MNAIRFLSWWLIVVISVSITNAAEQCRTPEDQPGDCKLLDQCYALSSLLKKKPPLEGNLALLRRSSCGFKGRFPKVCCPLDNPNISSPTVDLTKSMVNESISSAKLPSTKVCGFSNSDRILYGNKTLLDHYPWMALIEYEKPNGQRGFHCGGALINNRYILTAAHCIKGKQLPSDWKLISVRLREHDLKTEQDCDTIGDFKDCSDSPLNIEVEEAIVHEDYNPDDANQYHDIALLRLKKNISYKDFVLPICLTNNSDYVFEKVNNYRRRVIGSGWNRTEENSGLDAKYQFDSTLLSPSNCSTYRDSNLTLGEDQFCALINQGENSCIGDSGGPLFDVGIDDHGEASWYMIGVSAIRTPSCGTSNSVEVYTNVFSYVKWITGKLRD